MGNRFRRWGLPAAVSVQRRSAESLPSLEARGLLLTFMLLPPDTTTSVEQLADDLEDCPRRVAAHAMKTLVVYRFVVKVRYQLSSQPNPKLNGTWVTEILHKDVPFTLDDLLDIAVDYGPGVLIDSWRGTDRVNVERMLVHHKPPVPLEARTSKRGQEPRYLFDRTAPVPRSVPEPPESDIEPTAAPVDNRRLPRSHRPTENGMSVPPAETGGSGRSHRLTENGMSVPPAETGGSGSSHRQAVDRPLGERSVIFSSPSVRSSIGRTDGDPSFDRGGTDAAAAANSSGENGASEGPKEVVVQDVEQAPVTTRKAKTQYSPEAWTVVLALRWPSGQRPHRTDAVKLAARLDAVVAEGELTLAELEEHLNGRLKRAGANPAAYLLGALKPEHLPIPHLRQAEVDAAADAKAEPDAVVEIPQPEPEPSRLQTYPWCGNCREPSRTVMVKKPTGKGLDMVPCENCHPNRQPAVIDTLSPVAALAGAGTLDNAGSSVSGDSGAENGPT